MLFSFLKKEAPQPQGTLQYIGFPVESFDLLSKGQKNYYYRMIKKGGWEFAIRALGWVVECRVSDEPLPDTAKGEIFGVEGARIFSQKEVDDLREYVQTADHSYILGALNQGEDRLKEVFEAFAGKTGLVRTPYLRAFRVMCHLASKGCEVTMEDLRSNPMFRRLGNVAILFGDRVHEVLEFQNHHARQISAELD
jgi:hypothetical protein